MNIMQETRKSHVYPESKVATAIERKTAQMPSDWFLWAAGISILGSLALKTMKRDSAALFVGEWAPTFLLLGLYNKMVKMWGSE